MHPLVLGGIGDSSVIEYPRNRRLAVALRKEREYLSYHSGGFLVNNQVTSQIGILLVATERKRADVKSVSAATVKRRFDAVRHILKIPLVDKSVDLTAFFVALVGSVGVVHNTDETDAPDREQTVYVPLHKLKLTGKSRLRFAKDNVKLFRLRVGKQALELGTVAVGASVIIVTVNAVKIPAHLARVVTKHRLLILNAARIVGGVLLIFIFF